MFNNPLYSNNSMFMKPSLLSGLKNINWGTFLGNAQKTLGKNWQEVAEEYYEEYIKIITKRTDS